MQAQGASSGKLTCAIIFPSVIESKAGRGALPILFIRGSVSHRSLHGSDNIRLSDPSKLAVLTGARKANDNEISFVSHGSGLGLDRGGGEWSGRRCATEQILLILSVAL